MPMPRWFAPLTVVVAAMFAYAPISIANAPFESTMLLVQKIFYFHVPSWFVMFSGAFLCAGASVSLSGQGVTRSRPLRRHRRRAGGGVRPDRADHRTAVGAQGLGRVVGVGRQADARAGRLADASSPTCCCGGSADRAPRSWPPASASSAPRTSRSCTTRSTGGAPSIPKTTVVPTLGPGMRGTFWFCVAGVHAADGADRRGARPPRAPSRAGRRSVSGVGGLNMSAGRVPAGASCCCGCCSQPDRRATSRCRRSSSRPSVPAQDEFVPLDELPPQEQLPAAPLLIAAYSVAWWSSPGISSRSGGASAASSRRSRRSAAACSSADPDPLAAHPMGDMTAAHFIFIPECCWSASSSAGFSARGRRRMRSGPSCGGARNGRRAAKARANSQLPTPNSQRKSRTTQAKSPTSWLERCAQIVRHAALGVGSWELGVDDDRLASPPIASRFARL